MKGSRGLFSIKKLLKISSSIIRMLRRLKSIGIYRSIFLMRKRGNKNRRFRSLKKIKLLNLIVGPKLINKNRQGLVR